MPTKAQWSTFVDIHEFTKLCTKGKIRKNDSPEKYPMELPNQYTANQVQLKGFILSPEKIVNSQDEMLVYKDYLSELRDQFPRHTGTTVDHLPSPSYEDT
jgi:hypothetical protein